MIIIIDKDDENDKGDNADDDDNDNVRRMVKIQTIKHTNILNSENTLEKRDEEQNILANF